jgi:hypothetical protein
MGPLLPLPSPCNTLADALNTHRMTLADVPARFPSLLDPAAGVVKAIVEV